MYNLARYKIFLRLAPSWLLKKLSNRQFLMVGAIAVGIWAGLTAVVLKISVHYLQDVLVTLSQRFNWLYLVSPAVGIALTFLFIRFFLRGEFVRGTHHVLLAIAKKSSLLPKQETYCHAATSALTVGLGGSAGLESPIVQTGSAIGSVFASFFPVGYRDRTLLLACGAASGIAAAFNAPIAGVLFALEVLLVDVSISAFIPLLIAGACGALCSKIILADDILLSFKNVSAFNFHNVPYYVVLGGCCGLISVFYMKAFRKTENLLTSSIKSPVSRLVAGSLLLGILIFLFPALFGEGYSSIKSLALSRPLELFNGSPLKQVIVAAPWLPGLAVLVVALIKAMAVSLTLSAGGNGGNFAPALLVGACLGFAFSYLADTAVGLDLPVANFCLVAMAGVLTGIFHAPLTGIFLIAEITGGYELMIPLMIVSAFSTAVSRYLHPDSLDQAKLKAGEQRVTLTKETYILSDLVIPDIVEKDFVPVKADATMRNLIDVIAQSRRNIFPVLDGDQRLVGIILLDDIREIMFDTALYDTLRIEQLMQKPVVVTELDENMSEVMEKFDKYGLWNIPVVNRGKYVGFISKSQIFSNYRDKLKTD